MDEVETSGRGLVIAKNGHPVLRLVSYQLKPDTLYGIDQGRFEILDDIIAPIDITWEAESNPDRVIDP